MGDEHISSFVWENVSGIAGLDLLALHKGETLYFYRLDGPDISGKQSTFSIDLNQYNVSNSFPISESPIQFATIKGYLVLVSPAFDAIYVQYNSILEQMTSAKIEFRVRDFNFIGSPSKYSVAVNQTGVESDSQSIKRRYDTYNAGWLEAPLLAYSSAATSEDTKKDSGFQNDFIVENSGGE